MSMNVAKRTVAKLSMGLLSAAFAFMSGDAFRVNDAVAQEEAAKKPQAWYPRTENASSHPFWVNGLDGNT
jgi:hypothetical protein